MLNPSRLEDLKRKMKSNFDAGKVAGCSLLVCRKGEETYLEHGFANVERRDPVRTSGRAARIQNAKALIS